MQPTGPSFGLVDRTRIYFSSKAAETLALGEVGKAVRIAGDAGGKNWMGGRLVENKAEVCFLSENFRLAEGGG